MHVCLAPKVYGFSVAMVTYNRREEFQKGRETRTHTFHTVRVPRSHPSWWKKARGGGFARTAKENLGSILKVELNFCSQVLAARTPGRQKDVISFHNMKTMGADCNKRNLE